ncbi:unnamed protein product [Amaranthus hypochondriacus]
MEDRSGCSPSLKYKLKNSFCGCFKQFPNHYNHLTDEFIVSPKSPMVRSSSTEEFKLKHKCRFLMNRISGNSPKENHQFHHHRKSHSTDFRYDPISYSLNFQQENSSIEDDFPFRDFSSRLPSSPLSSRGRPSSTVGPIRSVSDTVVVQEILSSNKSTIISLSSADSQKTWDIFTPHT